MNSEKLFKKYKVELSGGLVACHPLDDSNLSHLQMKMMNHYGIDAVLPCFIVHWNETYELIYLLQGRIPVKEQSIDFSKDQCIQMVRKLMEALVQIEKSGYLFPENVLIDREFLFYDRKTQKLDILYFPEEMGNGQSTGSFCGGILHDLSDLMENTKLRGVFEWEQCKINFAKCTSTESMYHYFQNSFPESGSAKRGGGRRKIATVVLKEKNKGIELRMPIGSGECVIGRGNVYALNQFPTVSGRHCKLYMREGKAFVMDLGSTNGTFLNGEILKPSREYLIQEKEELALSSLKFAIHFEWEN